MRPAGFASSQMKLFSIARLPTPHALRHCQHDQFTAHWNVNEGKAHMTLPDLTIGFRIEAVSLAGVHVMKINRFDAASHFLAWGPTCMPNPSHKKLMCKFFGHIMTDWRDDIGLLRTVGPQPPPQNTAPPPAIPSFSRAAHPPCPLHPVMDVNHVNHNVPIPGFSTNTPVGIVCPQPV